MERWSSPKLRWPGRLLVDSEHAIVTAQDRHRIGPELNAVLKGENDRKGMEQKRRWLAEK
jgi:hypothetical protein